MTGRRIVIFGAGGFAREVAWLLREDGRTGEAWDFRGYVVSDLEKLGVHDSKDEVLGDLAWLDRNQREFDAVVIGIGSPLAKRRVVEEVRGRCPDLRWPSIVHPSVQYDRERTTIEEGVVICAGVIATVGVRFRAFAMANLACTVGHEAEIGPYAVMNPTVNVSGGVVLEEEVLVGTGAQILQYVRVGARSSVGAGAVVTKDVGPGTTVVGIPAKPLPARAPS
jgi:sugar O-acyltransferase (sialic acid O-acetyltransferase NeuD family)